MTASLPPPNASRSISRTYFVALVFFVILAVYTWVYYFEPITPYLDYYNDKVGDTLVLVVAVAAALWGTQLTRHFKPSEPPHHIWLAFTIGWWAWVGGELLGFVYDYYYWTTDYPELTFIDLCWSLGYVFFGLSLYYQFRLIYSWKSGRKTVLYLLFIGLALAVTFGFFEWARAAGLGEGYSWFALYLAVLYPVFDVFEGLAALWLFFLFGRGYLGRPWWGLIAFALADSINIYAWMGGFDNTPDNVYIIYDVFSAVMYILGYMITALAFFSAVGHIHAVFEKSNEPVAE